MGGIEKKKEKEKRKKKKEKTVKKQTYSGKGFASFSSQDAKNIRKVLKRSKLKKTRTNTKWIRYSIKRNCYREKATYFTCTELILVRYWIGWSREGRMCSRKMTRKKDREETDAEKMQDIMQAQYYTILGVSGEKIGDNGG